MANRAPFYQQRHCFHLIKLYWNAKSPVSKIGLFLLPPLAKGQSCYLIPLECLKSKLHAIKVPSPTSQFRSENLSFRIIGTPTVVVSTVFCAAPSSIRRRVFVSQILWKINEKKWLNKYLLDDVVVDFAVSSHVSLKMKFCDPRATLR